MWPPVNSERQSAGGGWRNLAMSKDYRPDSSFRRLGSAARDDSPNSTRSNPLEDDGLPENDQSEEYPSPPPVEAAAAFISKDQTKAVVTIDNDTAISVNLDQQGNPIGLLRLIRVPLRYLHPGTPRDARKPPAHPVRAHLNS